MSQNPLNIANASGAGAAGVIRAALNSAFLSLVTRFSGAGAPSPIHPFMEYLNTTDGYVYEANAAGDAFRVVRPIDPSIPVSTGAAGTYAVAYAPALGSYKEGVILAFKADKVSVGADSLNANGIGVKSLYIFSGVGFRAIAAGDIQIGGIYNVYFDSINDRFIIFGQTSVSTDLTNYTPTVTGFSSIQRQEILYSIIGNLVFISFSINGTSNLTSFTFTLPVISADRPVGFYGYTGICQIMDNDIVQAAAGLINIGNHEPVAYIHKDLDGASFTASGGKGAWGQFFYMR